MANVTLRPTLGRARIPHPAGRFLLICFYDPNGISTVWENINLLKTHSRFDFSVLNLWPGRGGPIFIPPSVDLNDYDGVFIHPTACYSFSNLEALDSKLKAPLRDYKGVKIIAKQDEHYLTAHFDAYLCDCNFDMILSCVPKAELAKAYPRCVEAGIVFMETLTGYVSDHMQAMSRPAYESRPIDLSYRGSLQPVSFGRLGFEKWFIGVQVDTHVATASLSKDISSRWQDRINGEAWYSFLGRSKAVLGVESGSNLFDFDGSTKASCDALTHGRSEPEIYTEAFYRSLAEGVLRDKEGNVHYAQISPRHFEACAAGALQIMYEGQYSRIFKPYQHFFPLKRDLSNIEEAVALIRDEAAWQRMTDAAFEEIIQTDRYSYRRFVKAFDEELQQLMDQRGKGYAVATAGSGSKPGTEVRVLNLFAHEPTIDPRIEWHSVSLEPNYFVCELGTFGFRTVATQPKVTKVNARRWRVQVERRLHGETWRHINPAEVRVPSVFRSVMLLLRNCRDTDDAHLGELVGAHDAEPEDFLRFRSLCDYMLNTNSALFEAAQDIGPFDIVICADLESLPAAIGLKELWGCRVAFDSHEFWPFSYIDARHWENDFWSRIEHALSQSSDLNMTVSAPLAATLSSEYGVPFHLLPNACRLGEAPQAAAVEAARSRRADKTTVDFLFQGNFAPGRGLEHLVAHWPHAPQIARLLLRGPDNIHRRDLQAQAEKTGLLGKSIFFLEAVPEHQLVEAALAADVGVIPYDPSNYGYRFACPNKLSQYMAAGLPVFTNEIEYVTSVVRQGDCGVSAHFSDRNAFIAAVTRLVADAPERARLGQNARAYFEAEFNWEKLAPPVYAELFEGVMPMKVPPDMAKVRFSPTLSAPPAGMSEAAGCFLAEASTSSGFEGKWLHSGPMVAVRFIWRKLPERMRRLIRDILLRR